MRWFHPAGLVRRRRIAPLRRALVCGLPSAAKRRLTLPAPPWVASRCSECLCALVALCFHWKPYAFSVSRPSVCGQLGAFGHLCVAPLCFVYVASLPALAQTRGFHLALVVRGSQCSVPCERSWFTSWCASPMAVAMDHRPQPAGRARVSAGVRASAVVDTVVVPSPAEG